MIIDWAQFTPGASLGGGALIGLAVALLYVVTGRIAGVSGIFGEALMGAREGGGWRWAFLMGLVAASWLAPDGLVVVERSARDMPFAWPDVLGARWHRRYGETTLYFATKEPA